MLFDIKSIMKAGILALILFYLIGVVFSAECHGHPGKCLRDVGPVHENLSPIIYANPKPLRTSTNGKLYSVGDLTKNAMVHLIHVYGNMYQMGYAQG